MSPSSITSISTQRVGRCYAFYISAKEYVQTSPVKHIYITCSICIRMYPHGNIAEHQCVCQCTYRTHSACPMSDVGVRWHCTPLVFVWSRLGSTTPFSHYHTGTNVTHFATATTLHIASDAVSGRDFRLKSSRKTRFVMKCALAKID